VVVFPANEDFSPCLGRVARRAGLQLRRYRAFLVITMPRTPYRLLRRAKLWSAAACCRFPSGELARGNFTRECNSPPASWLATKRQQAAALQSVAPIALLRPLGVSDHVGVPAALGKRCRGQATQRRPDHEDAEGTFHDDNLWKL